MSIISFIILKELHHYNTVPYKTILFLRQYLYFPSKLTQIYNIRTKLAIKLITASFDKPEASYLTVKFSHQVGE